MDDASFRDLVRMMRAAQKRYFNLRTDGDLKEAKRLEREVDKALTTPAAEQLKVARQGDLFGEGT